MKCSLCQIEFEPKTTILYKQWDIGHKLVDSKPDHADLRYHVGCWARKERNAHL